jgi:hypothetical protein
MVVDGWHPPATVFVVVVGSGGPGSHGAAYGSCPVSGLVVPGGASMTEAVITSGAGASRGRSSSQSTAMTKTVTTSRLVTIRL